MDPGTRLGHYEILAPLGAGGMGQVYRARDTTLDRDVAIKVLPEDFASDANRLARFEREAKLLASLNHPNIATIHGFDESDGVRFIAMELVEGQSLAERIAASGRIEIDEALEIARRIALALEAAHEAGVIHRDLKPANVQVATDGTVKVLDFGLAKAYEVDGSDPSSDLSHSPTMMAATGAGVIMGTAPYMSPEQARGTPVDKRSDIWAFGCVLYEMLSGHRTFAADSVSETLAEVLKSEPDWSRLPVDTPDAIRRLLRRSLRKDPRVRLPDIGVARLEIDDAVVEPAGPQPPAGQPPSGSGWRQRLPWALAALFAVAAGVGIWTGLQPRDAPPPQRLDMALPFPQQLARSAEGGVSPIALSPDGQLFADVAARPGATTQLFLRAIDAFESRPIEGSQRAQAPFFSPDGRSIGFFANEALWKVSLPDGQPLKIADMTVLFPSASWGVDGTIIFSNYSLGLAEVSAEGGEPEPLTHPDPEHGELRYFAPQILPGGRSVLFTVADADSFFVAVLSRESNQWHRVLDNAESARYVSTGHLVFAPSGALHAISFELDGLETSGAAFSTAERVPSAVGLGAQRFAVSDAGTLAYLPEDAGATSTRLVWVDRQGGVIPILDDPAPFRSPRVSPDGKRIAIIAGTDIWVYDAERATPSVLTTDGYNLSPLWDGDRLLFSAVRSGAYFDIHSVPANGGAEPELLLRRESRQFPFSRGGPDMSVISFVEVTPVGGDVGMLEGGTASIVLDGAYNEHSPVFHPDGRWFAYVSDESGEEEVYVTRYPERADRVPVSRGGGREPVWSRDGRELFYRNGERVMVVDVQSTDNAFTAESPQELFQGRFSLLGVGTISYDVAPDGRFVMLQLPEVTSSRIKVVLHWLEELKELVATGGR